MSKVMNNKQASVERILTNNRKKRELEKRKTKNAVKKQDNVDKLLSKRNKEGIPKFVNLLLNWLDKLMLKLNEEDKEVVREKMNKKLSKRASK